MTMQHHTKINQRQSNFSTGQFNAERQRARSKEVA